MIQSEIKQLFREQDKTNIGLTPILFVVGSLFILAELLIFTLVWVVMEIF